MIITQTPLRVSLLGGGTDFPDYYKEHGGLVLTTAIDKYIYCIVKPHFGREVVVNYSTKEVVTDVKDLKHDLVREALQLLEITEGIEITFLGDIPTKGSGLGSSSTVTVGLLNALHQYKSETVSARDLMNEACHIELDLLKAPIGVQDQAIAALGNLRVIRFPRGGEVINLSEETHYQLENSLMLLYTGIERSASQVLQNVNWSLENRNQLKELAEKGINLLKDGNIEGLGKTLHEAWMVKKQLNGVTNPQIEKMYEEALSAGAYGGKLLGAGGGGFLLLMVPNRIKLPYKELKIRLAKQGSRVILNI